MFLKEKAINKSIKKDLLDLKTQAASLSGFIDGYRFGCITIDTINKSNNTASDFVKDHNKNYKENKDTKIHNKIDDNKQEKNKQENNKQSLLDSKKIKEISLSESELLRKYTQLFDKGYDDISEYDEWICSMIYEWNRNHTGLLISKCSVLVLINRSYSPIQLLRIQFVQGKNVHVMGSLLSGYNQDSR